MRKLLVGNAPCSWGTLEFEAAKGEQMPFDRMLDELAEAGYTGTELGDWGYMPTDPATLRAQLNRRGLVMLGAFVPVALKYPAAHSTGIANAVKTARLLAGVAGTPAPYLVLADDNGTEPMRTRLAGRVTAESGLSPAEWRIFAGGADRLARAVFDETGLRTTFHHHCAGYVETPDEIAILLELTDPRQLGLVFFAWLVSTLTGVAITDPANGLRAMRAEVTEKVPLRQPQYQTSELLIGAIARGFVVKEVPATVYRRAAGDTKKGGNLIYGLHFAKVVVTTWWAQRPVARRHLPAGQGLW